MDLLSEGRVNKINELAKSVLADSRRRAARDSAEFVPPPRQMGHLGLSDDMVRDYSVMRAVRKIYKSLMGNLSTDGRGFDGPEAAYSRELEKVYGLTYSGTSFYVPSDVTHSRAMSTTPGGKGGYAVGAEIVGFIDALSNTSVCFKLGSQRIQNQQANAIFVKETPGPTVTWQGPNGTSIAPVDPGFTQLTATPHTLIGLHELSAQLIHQTNGVTEAGVIRGLGLSLAVGVDQAMLSGSGGLQPIGVSNSPGVITVVGTSIDRAKLIDMQGQCNNSNAIINPLAQGYVGPPSVAALAAGRQQFPGVDSPLWQGSIAQGMVVGVPAMSSKSMPASSLLFGDFSQLMLVEFGPLQIAVNHADFNKATVAIRALWMVDVIVLEPKAFTLATGVS